MPESSLPDKLSPDVEIPADPKNYGWNRVYEQGGSQAIYDSLSAEAQRELCNILEKTKCTSQSQ